MPGHSGFKRNSVADKLAKQQQIKKIYKISANSKSDGKFYSGFDPGRDQE